MCKKNFPYTKHFHSTKRYKNTVEKLSDALFQECWNLVPILKNF